MSETDFGGIFKSAICFSPCLESPHLYSLNAQIAIKIKIIQKNKNSALFFNFNSFSFVLTLRVASDVNFYPYPIYSILESDKGKNRANGKKRIQKMGFGSTLIVIDSRFSVNCTLSFF